MKTEATDRDRWSKNLIAGVALLQVLAIRRAFQCCAALGLIVWLCGFSAPRADARDLDPQLVGKWPTAHPRGAAWDVAVQDGFAYCAIGHGGLAIIDVRDPANPKCVGGYGPGNSAQRVAVSGNYAYIGYFDAYDTTGAPTDVAVSGNYAYVVIDVGSGLAGSGVVIVDVASSAAPTWWTGRTGKPRPSARRAANSPTVLPKPPAGSTAPLRTIRLAHDRNETIFAFVKIPELIVTQRLP